MLRILALTFLLFVGSEAMAEIPVQSPTPACLTTVTQVRVYRCVCRANLVSVSGTTNVSTPVTLSNGLTYIYSANNLNGNECTGTIANAACNPAVLNGATITGSYNCALGNTTEAGGFEIR